MELLALNGDERVQNLVLRACILEEVSPPTHPTNSHTHTMLAPVANGKCCSSLKKKRKCSQTGLKKVNKHHITNEIDTVPY